MKETVGFAMLLAAWYWALVVVFAMIATGLIQWTKDLVKRPWRWLWSLMLPLLTWAMSVAVMPWPWWLLLWGSSWMLGQLQYELLLQVLLSWIRRVAGLDISAPAPPASPPGPPA